MVMTIAGPGDALDDATVLWPADREEVDVGTLTIDKVESEEGNEARILNFDPLILRMGFRLLPIRSSARARRRIRNPPVED